MTRFPSFRDLCSRPKRPIEYLGTGLVASLVFLGVFRSVLLDAVDGFHLYWSAVLIATAVAGTLAIGYAAIRPRLQWAKLLLALFPLVMALGYLQPQRVASDGAFYYAPLRSLILDFDLDFENEYRVLGAHPEAFVPTRTGHLPNHFSVGPAILWSPAFLFVHGVAKLGLFRATGFGYPYFTAVATASMFFGFIGVLAMFDLIRAVGFEARFAFLGCAAIWLTSFHLWYMTFEASMSHAPAMMTVSLFALYSFGGLNTRREWILAGVLAGAMILVRWQNLVFLPLALLGTPIPLSRESLRNASAMIAAAVLVCLPQGVYWYVIYGEFLLIPQGRGFMNWTNPNIGETLFSSRHGLFSWSPLLLVGLAGFPSAWRKAPRLILISSLCVILSTYVNASVSDWWAGASFGARRFDGALAFFGIGLTACIVWFSNFVERRPLFACGLVLAPFVLWNGILMEAYSSRRIPVDGASSFHQVLSDGLERLYRQTGYPFSWPGALGRWAARGEPLHSYDLLGSQILYNNIEFRMGGEDSLFLGRGWSSLDRRTLSRGIEGGEGAVAEIYLPIREAVLYRLKLGGLSDSRIVELRVNGSLLGELETLDDSVEASVPKALLRAGVNVLTLEMVSASPVEIGSFSFRRRGSY